MFFFSRNPFTNCKTDHEVRKKLADLLLIFIAIVSIPTLAGSLIRIPEHGWIKVMTLHTALAVSLWVAALLRKHIPHTLKAILVCFPLYAIGISSVFNIGLTAQPSAILILGTLLIAIFWGYFYSVIACIVSSVAFLIIGYGITHSYIQMSSIEPHYNHLFSSWITASVLFFFCSCIAVILAGWLFHTLVQQNLELKKIRRELEEKNVLLSNQSNERKELIHILCHDLANPVGSIKTNIEIMTEKEKNRPGLDLIKLSSESCFNIIQQIKALMLAEQTLDDDMMMVTPVTELIDEAKLILSYRLESKNISLKIDADPSMKVRVIPIIFTSSVINNLLTNAIKFSYPNSEISCSVKQLEDKVELTIKDSGIGMPPEILNSLFELNKTTSREGTEGESGTGFGMPLVKKYVEAFGGEISVFSKEKTDDSEDSGTTAVITMPPAN